ncbi:MAG: hypothetical protein ACPIOQ_48095 [Promethearchaeia archaeon]
MALVGPAHNTQAAAGLLQRSERDAKLARGVRLRDGKQPLHDTALDLGWPPPAPGDASFMKLRAIRALPLLRTRPAH